MYKLLINRQLIGTVKHLAKQHQRLAVVRCTSSETPSSDFKPSEELLRERYESRSSEEMSKKKARLVYQSRKRGMLENGVILASFADKYLQEFDEKQLDEYDRLINLPTNDWDIYYWATKTKPTPSEFETSVMQKLREHLKEKVSHGGDEQEKQDEKKKHFTQRNKADDDEFMVPVVEEEFKLDIDPSEVDLTNIQKLFDKRTVRLKKGLTMEKMTAWRRKFFVKRIRRTIPAPISLTGLGDGVQPRYWTQKMGQIMRNLSKQLNEEQSKLDSLGDLEFNSTLVWLLENKPELVLREMPEVYELYKEKSKLEQLKQFVEENKAQKFTSLVARFPLAITDLIDKTKAASSPSHVSVDSDSEISIAAKVSKNADPIFAISNEIDTDYQKFLKHHNFLQHLLQSPFSTDARDYDDEAEAWSEQVWHRNYGSSDPNCPPSEVPCGGCGALLHCCDSGLPGFVTKEEYMPRAHSNSLGSLKCQRCKFIDLYNVSLSVNIPREDYANVISKIRQDRSAIVVLLVDLLDFPCSIWPGLLDIVGAGRPLLIVGNKLDLLPKDNFNYLKRILRSLKSNLRQIRFQNPNLQITDVMTISAKTGFAVENLVTRLMSLCEFPRNIYLVGCTNSGKSTLFNALLQSDLSAIRRGDILTRASTSIWPGTTLNLLKFPVAQLDSWQVEMRKRRLERVERDTKRRERSLLGVTKHRQLTAPHMSQMIERIEPTMSIRTNINQPQYGDNTETAEGHDESIGKHLPKFTADHPLIKHLAADDIRDRTPFSLDETKFEKHTFFYDTPGAVYSDQIVDLLTAEEVLRVVPRETIVPRTYSLRPLETIFISGLARIDLLTSGANIMITILASNYLPVHVVPTRHADAFYYTFLGTDYLGVPIANSARRLEHWPELLSAPHDFHITQRGRSYDGVADIVLSSAGWAMISPSADQQCLLRAYTPLGRGIYERRPALLPHASRLRGRKIRDTPCYENRFYTIEQRMAADGGGRRRLTGDFAIREAMGGDGQHQ